MANTVFGEVAPKRVTQANPRACLSACGVLFSEYGNGPLREDDISGLLAKFGLQEGGDAGLNLGVDLHPAVMLDEVFEKVGLTVNALYDARVPGDDEVLEYQEAVGRLGKIDKALRSGEKVLVAFPRRREGQDPFQHYAAFTGFEEKPEGDGVTVMDPSEIDGGIKNPTPEELLEYVTPARWEEEGWGTFEIPVMAWTVSSKGKTRRPELYRFIEEAEVPGLSLLVKPLCEVEDTGAALPPDTNHPTSVVMPTAEVSEQFNVLDDVVLSMDGTLPVGYPRFVPHPLIKTLALEKRGRFRDFPFPSLAAAQATAYMERSRYSDQVSSRPVEQDGVFWLPYSKPNSLAWQHAGLGLSSRQAAAILEGRPENDIAKRDQAETEIRTIIAEHTGAKAEDIYLLPTGMAAFYLVNQALMKMAGEAPGVQFGFPYTDSFEQRNFGPVRNIKNNVLDLRQGDYDQLQELVDSGQDIRSVTTEFPSNPLLWTPHLERMHYILDGKAPIVLDDTVGSIYNLDDNKLPDSVVARVTSLTKYFSSPGNAMGGSIVLRPESPYYEQLKTVLEGMYEDNIWYEDAEALAKNGGLLSNVMPAININGQEVAEWLHENWTNANGPLQTVYYPSVNDTKEAYDEIAKNSGGYSGLMSLQFKEAITAYKFFRELKLTKGPSLGTFYTLACMYTLLAHKPPASVRGFGVAPDLVRLSVGIEPVDGIKAALGQAFEAAA